MLDARVQLHKSGIQSASNWSRRFPYASQWTSSFLLDYGLHCVAWHCQADSISLAFQYIVNAAVRITILSLVLRCSSTLTWRSHDVLAL